MIELQGIGKTYTPKEGSSVRALDGVSLTIGRGELLAIVGSSGSGKSTLLNVLGLLDPPTEGRFLWDGADVSGLDRRRTARLRNERIGFVFQAFHLMPRATARENVELPLLYSDRTSIDGLGLRALETVGLAERASHRPSEMSGGQQQRVAIARALVNEPDLLLADEPTGNLDPGTAREILALFRSLNEGGRTIVVVTHDAGVASECGRVARIEGGRIVSNTGRAASALPGGAR